MRWLLAFLAVTFSTAGAELFFKDGTKVNADLFDAKPEGVVLLIQGKVYIHHYPFHKEAFAPPEHNAFDNPFHLPSCAPTRISYFHFAKNTQDDLVSKYKKVGTPAAIAIAERIESDKYISPKELKLEPAENKSLHWRAKVLKEFHYSFDTKKAVWGNNLQ